MKGIREFQKHSCVGNFHCTRCNEQMPIRAMENIGVLLSARNKSVFDRDETFKTRHPFLVYTSLSKCIFTRTSANT